ncbi:protein misato [Contarinia nasturtii]|uniref:protein misato n=1 Tax=Contarinia nasturtii TaxID=265458 RepID=UPI0012D45656|nr:protein misato [Contarinia nasturtii]
MAFTREVITFQIGNYSNYVGTHWWNIQESAFCYDPNGAPSEVSNDILFREGVNQQGSVTYTPRLLLIDNRGALSHMPTDGGLYSDQAYLVKKFESDAPTFTESDTLWEPNRLELLKEQPIEKPEYQQDLDQAAQSVEEKHYDFRNKTSSWADYMYTRYHPRSINLLPALNKSNEISFDCYTRGAQVWTENYFDDNFGDNIRQYIEECNNCQGFQMLFDANDAFSGLALKVLEHVQDEYGKTSLTIPIFSPKQIFSGPDANDALCDSTRVINSALTYGNLIDFSSMILPLSTMSRCWRNLSRPRVFPHVKYDSSNLYETSAILATYLDTISLRYRMSEAIDGCHLASFCNDLTNYGRKLTAAGLAMPFNMSAEHDLIDCLDQFDGKLFTQLSPNSEVGTDRIVQSVCVRGIPENRVKNTKSQKEVERQQKMAAYRCDSVAEMFQLYFQCSNYNSLSHVSAQKNAMSTKKPFPMEMFDSRLNSQGFRTEFEMSEEESANNKVGSIPVLATAQTSNDLADTIESLHREAKRIKIARIHRFKESGLEQDEYEETLEKISEFKDNYEDAFEL